MRRWYGTVVVSLKFRTRPMEDLGDWELRGRGCQDGSQGKQKQTLCNISVFKIWMKLDEYYVKWTTLGWSCMQIKGGELSRRMA